MTSKTNHEVIDNNSLKLIIIGCIVIFIALVAMSVSSILITQRAVLNKLKTSDLTNMASSISVTIEGRIDKAVDASLLMATNPVIEKWITKGETSGEDEGIAKRIIEEMVNELHYDTAFLASRVTNHYWSCSGTTVELLDNLEVTDEADQWFFEALKLNKRYDINIEGNTELNNTFVWINVLIGDLNNPIGIAGVGMNLEKVVDELILEQSSQQVANDIWLVNDEGRILLSKDPQYVNHLIEESMPDKLVQAIQDPTLSNTTLALADYKNNENITYDLAYKRIKDTNWKLVVQIPRSQSLGFLNQVIFNTLVVGILIVFFMIGSFYFVSTRIANPFRQTLALNELLEKQVVERTMELTEKNRKIQDSIDYAKKIQEAVLDNELTLRQLFPESFALWKPRDTVGGDFIWAASFEKGLLVIVGDCTGHGIPGALMTTAIATMLTHSLTITDYSNPSELLYTLNKMIHSTFASDSHRNHEVQDGLDLGALFIVPNEEIRFAGARINLFIQTHQGTQMIRGSKDTLDSRLMQREKVFVTQSLPFEVGMRLYMVTDGFTDQLGGINKMPFGKKRFVQLLEQAIHIPMYQQKQFFVDEFNHYLGDESVRDDYTLIGIELHHR